MEQGDGDSSSGSDDEPSEDNYSEEELVETLPQDKAHEKREAKIRKESPKKQWTRSPQQKYPAQISPQNKNSIRAVHLSPAQETKDLTTLSPIKEQSHLTQPA
jgi:hypothetical protein